MDTLEKFHKIFLHILLFQNILRIFFILRKKWHFLAAVAGGTSAKNAIFFYVLPLPVWPDPRLWRPLIWSPGEHDPNNSFILQFIKKTWIFAAYLLRGSKMGEK